MVAVSSSKHQEKDTLQDKQLIQLIANGDQSAFKSLYGLFNERVYNTAISYAQNQQDAEEITQDVFTTIYRKAHQFKGDAKAGTWIYRIATNTSLNYLKKKKGRSLINLSLDNNDRPDFDHPGMLLERKEQGRALFKVIDTLPDSQKTAFILSFIEDLPRQEVADIMHTSLKATESLLQRAKKNLRVKLIKDYPNRRKFK